MTVGPIMIRVAQVCVAVVWVLAFLSAIPRLIPGREGSGPIGRQSVTYVWLPSNILAAVICIVILIICSLILFALHVSLARENRASL